MNLYFSDCTYVYISTSYNIKKRKNIFIEGCAIFFSLSYSLTLRVYPLGTNNISLTGFSFGIWNENLQKLWNIYIFSDRTCAYPFYFPHPFLHVLSAFFFRLLCAVLKSPMAYEKVMSGDIINLFSSFFFAATPTLRYGLLL